MRRIFVAFLLVAVASTFGFLFLTMAQFKPVDPGSPVQKQVLAAKVVDMGQRLTTSQLDFFGDIMLDRNVAQAMGKRGLDYIFARIATGTLIVPGNYTVANLEGPFAPTRIATTKTIAFRFDPALAPKLKQYGFDAFTMANNHSYDMGAANVLFTRRTLSKAGLAYFGDELSDASALVLVVTSSSKLAEPVAFVGVHATYRSPNLSDLSAALAFAKSSAKIVVVNVHAGAEYKRISNVTQRVLAHWLIDHGASAVIAHHPHVIEEAEVYNGAPIFYSLGNFIFDQYFSLDTQQGIKVTLTTQNGRVTEARITPFYSKNSQVYIMEGSEKQKMFDWFTQNSRFGSSTFKDGVLTL